MKRIRKIVLGGAAIALAGVIAGTVPMASGQDSTETAKPRFHRGERMHRGLGGAPLISIALKHQSELNLTSDQVANLEKIKNHYQSQVTPVLQQLTDNEKEIRALMQESPAQLIQIKKRIQESEKHRSELRYLRLEALENGRSVLTAAQQEQLKTLARSRRGHLRKPQGQPS
ncbi:MAG TPA: Spy/CpxP family protein refolding chaperone [Candidatus Binatia bacterium]|jgi:Spy/CpxP family protein refolding chaperone